MNSKVKLSILTQYFHPDVAATGQLLTELSFGLIKLNCKVIVYTAQPSYHYRTKEKSFEVFNGAEIHRLWSTKLNKNTRLGKVVNSITFFVSVLGKLLIHNDGSLLMIVSNPPFLPLIGYFLKIFKRRKYIWLVNDVYPDIAVTLNYLKKGGIIERLWHMINSLIFKKASAVIVLSDTMYDTLMKKFQSIESADQRSIYVIHNWVDEQFIKPIPKKESLFAIQNNLTDKFVVLYSGNMGISHDLETIIYAAAHLQDKNIDFIFIGDGAKRQSLVDLVRQLNISNVKFFPYQSRDYLPHSLTCSDVSIVTLEKNIDGLSMPSKLYSILATGRPVLALVESNSEVAKIIQNAKSGTIVSQSDVDSVIKVIMEYYSDPTRIIIEGNNGRKYLEEHFTLEKSSKKYHEIINTVLSND